MGTTYGKLDDAIFNNSKSTVKKLLTKTPSLINCRLNKIQVTPLIKAVSLNRGEIVSILLEKKEIHLNQQTFSGETASTRAAKFGYIQSLKKLTEAGSDLRIEDKEERNALDYSMIYGQFETAQFLLDQGLSLKSDSFYQKFKMSFSGVRVNFSKMREMLNQKQELNLLKVRSDFLVLRSPSNGNSQRMFRSQEESHRLVGTQSRSGMENIYRTRERNTNLRETSDQEAFNRAVNAHISI